MSHMNERGARTERGSALWGTGGRGGDRSSVLWGKGGRGMLVAAMVVALAAPLAATAAPGKGNSPAPAPTPAPTLDPTPTGGPANAPGGKTWVAPGLLDKGKTNPNDKINVIIQSSGGLDGAGKAWKWLAKAAGVDPSTSTNLSLVGGIQASVPAKWLNKLQQIPGLTVTPNALVKVSGLVSGVTSSQLWPYASGNSQLWLGDQWLYAGKTPAIAVVDSGVQTRADFGSRIIANVDLSTIPGNTSTDDQAGHGTFVAGIAAGAASDLAGADPVAPIVSIKVMDQNGEALTSDVINACQWILDHKDQYNIRVANFSLHSSYGTNFYRDPLDRAVEKLWFSGVTVVAAAGNYGTAGGPSGVKFSPGNDPFVITVGALDLNGTTSTLDDTVPSWSAYGYTSDGFYKPEVSAPGRYMVGPTPAGSTITTLKPGNMVGTDRIQLSGTSFAAPVVSGTVAEMLARHPNWTPDQVKGVLMGTARRVPLAGKAAGVGEITATRAAAAMYTPNPNRGLDRFLTADPSGGNSPVFDAMSWASAASADMSWNSMSWADQSWSDMSWADQSWSDMSWADMSWSDMSWADMSWADMSWADMSTEDAAMTDATTSTPGYVATPDQALDAVTDPDLAVPVDAGIDPSATDPFAAPATTDTSSTSTDTSTTSTDTSTTSTDTSTTSTDTSSTPTDTSTTSTDTSSTPTDTSTTSTDTSTTSTTTAPAP